MKMKKSFRVVLLGILFLLIYSTFSFFYVQNSVKELQHQKFLAVSNDFKNKVNTLIQEKQEAVILVSLSLAVNRNIKESLLTNDHTKINLADFSKTLANNTSLQNVWFQVIDTKGVSFYRSWTKKRLDSLVDIRLDVNKMLAKPQVISSISTGKFDITFKSMIPLYNDGNFIGSIETIAKFNSIAIKMNKETFETLVLVDKSYKEQLTKVSKSRFIEDYFVANLDPGERFLSLLKEVDIQKTISIKEYELNKKYNVLITSYKQPDIHGKDMGYILMAKKISEIDMSELDETKKRVISVLVFIFFLIIALAYYIYIVNYKSFVQRQNEKLEERVALKTSELNHIAHHDSLTKLPNRLLFLDRLKQTLKYATRRKQSVGILFLDLDRFKEVNDTHGHGIGDKLLIEITNKLKLALRDEDTIARLGGDEFTVMLSNIHETALVKIVNKIIDSMQDKVIIEGIEIYTTFSIGISMFPKDGPTSDILLRNADTAMYKAKENGKNSYQFYDVAMTEMAFKRIDLENDIKHALENGEFEPYFQVKVDATSDKTVGLEALIRWNHPTKGLVFPDEFIPFAEEIGLISAIDNYMMLESMKIVLSWLKDGLNPGILSLNLSAKQLDNNYMQEVEDIVKSTGFEYKNLELEILESQVINNPKEVIEILTQIRELGVKISIDDFGTGYSSLSYLKTLPIDKLKIDRNFVMNIPADKDDIAIVKTIINLAQNLKLELVAEGVETQEQADFLVKEGCNVLQGYFYSKPISAKDCKNYLKAKQ